MIDSPRPQSQVRILMYSIEIGLLTFQANPERWQANASLPLEHNTPQGRVMP